MEKIVVLNSGGFDSVVMCHEIPEDVEIHSLFFNYGQNSLELERKCSYDSCEKLDMVFHEIVLPHLYWSNSNFFGQEYKDKPSQYLEFRNLIFFSYALSFAQSVGATKIYSAILKDGTYNDTTKTFCDNFNRLTLESSGIEFITPFINLGKEDVATLSYPYRISPSEYNSCDTPINNEPCGECPDCLFLKDVREYTTINSPSKSFAEDFDSTSERFKGLVRETSVEELRFLLNNDCQLKCKHCFYGFENTVSPILPREKLLKALFDAIDLDVTNIHFAGKEPLFDESIFWYADKLNEFRPKATHDVVTNGINVPKFAQRLKDTGFKTVFLSVDDVIKQKTELRGVKNVTCKALESLNKEGIHSHVFIDLHEGNFMYVKDIINYLYSNFGVKDYDVRTIRHLGKAVNLPELTLEEVNCAFEQVKEVIYGDALINFNLGSSFTHRFLLPENSEFDIVKYINMVFDYVTQNVLPNIFLYPEAYCNRFLSQATLTPDGYLLGCAMDMSYPEYSKVAVGNINLSSMKDMFERGREQNIEVNCKKCNGCPKIFSTPL